MRGVVVALCLFAAAPIPRDVNIGTVLPSVPTVHAGRATGAGFVVDRRLLLTAAHIVEGETRVVVDFDGRQAEGTVIKRSNALDVAEIELQADAGVPSLPIASAEPAVGTHVFAVGSPLGTQAVSEGIVSGKPTQNGFPMLQTDAAVNNGNSGGPLVDPDGQVVGLVVSKIRDTDGIGLAVASPSLSRFLSDPAFPGADAERAASNPSTAANGSSHSVLTAIGALFFVALAMLGWFMWSRRGRRDDLDIRLGPVRELTPGGSNVDS